MSKFKSDTEYQDLTLNELMNLEQMLYNYIDSHTDKETRKKIYELLEVERELTSRETY